MSNPVGRGFHRQLGRELVDGAPMPNTEELKRAVTMPNANYQPMAFGPLGRVGTRAANWAAPMTRIDRQHISFRRRDFNDAYYPGGAGRSADAAPAGGEDVFLHNLTAEGQTGFQLPEIDLPVVFFYKKGGKLEHRAVIDTIVLEPDEGLFTMTWRATVPLKEHIRNTPGAGGQEVTRLVARRELGRATYPSLDHLIREQQAAAMEED